MNETFAKAEQLAKQVKEYANTKIELAKLEFAEKSSAVMANIIASVIVAVVFAFFLLFAGIGAAYALSEWIGKTYTGFLIIAGIYLIAGIIIWALRVRAIQIPIINNIIRQIFNNQDEHEEH